MNTYAKVQSLITAWKSQSLSRTDLIRAIAEACLGWPYVWGAGGQKCTPSHRRAYAARSACPEGEAARILKKCPVCSGKQEACSVCKYYPGGPVLDFDCRGFTRWLLAQAGVSLQGAGATSQWNTESNWEELENKGFAVVPRPFSALFSDCEKSPEALIYKAQTSCKIEFHLQNSGAFQGEKRGSKHQNKHQDFRLFGLESTRFV